ncbi:MAG: nucleoside permease [Opitutales bacterium]
MNTTVRVQLSVMMFLQFFVWGAWFVTMATYLGGTLDFTGAEIGLAYSTTAIAAMISPFFVGMIADRFFATERVLGVFHILGGLSLFWASVITTPTFFIWVLILHTLFYMPTLALVNALSFHQMKDPGREFPPIRVLGTIGWIAAGWMIVLLGSVTGSSIEATSLPLKLGAGFAILLGIYCFFLPHTPPQARGKKVTARDVLGLDALKLMKERSFLVFVISSLLICIPLAFYYNWTNPFLNNIGMENPAGKMTFGQISEIVFLLVMPFLFVRLGIKKMLMIGMFAWSLRYVLFAFGNNEALVFMLYGGIILHGICYDFFFVAGQIYVDKKAPVAIRGAAQGFIAFITLGVGMFIGFNISGWVVDYNTVSDGVFNWQGIWLVPAIMALAVLIGFALLFRERDALAEAKLEDEDRVPAPTNPAPASQPEGPWAKT